jgi:hypothetical protein
MKRRTRASSAASYVFVAHDDGSFTCGDCTPSSVDVGRPQRRGPEGRIARLDGPCRLSRLQAQHRNLR